MPPPPQAALNGARTDAEHPAIPRTAEELAAAAAGAVEAGAGVLHVHAFDASGAETLAAVPCAAAIAAIRATCSGAPISLTTSAEVEPDPRRRHEQVAAWTAQPDLVTANQGEEGIAELCELLIGRGVGIEAGLLEVADAEAFVASGLAPRCVRALVEPLDAEPAAALATAEAIEGILAEAAIGLDQVHHGDGIASWAVSERAAGRGHGIRTGLEDTVVMPGGELATDNAALVRAAVELSRRGSAP